MDSLWSLELHASIVSSKNSNNSNDSNNNNVGRGLGERSSPLC